MTNNKKTLTKSLDITAVGALVFSIFYILAELTFNLGLIDFLNSKNTEMDTFHQLEMFGRILSSIGIALFVSKLFLLSKNAEKVWFYGSFIIVAVITFSAQTLIFNKILDNMSNEQKINAYAFGVYRNLSLNNQTNVKILTYEDKNYNDVVNSMFGLFTTIPQTEKNIVNSVSDFFKAENSLDQKMLGQLYDELNTSIPNTDEYWKLYFIESKRYENYSGLFKSKYRENFEKSIGIPPSLNKEQFEKHLSKDLDSLKELNNVVLIPENKKLRMQQLKIGDIPKNLNKLQWINYVNSHINTAIEANSFSAKNVNILPHSRNIISSVVITPIAVVLSLIALLLNVVLLVARWTKIGGIVVLALFIGLSFSGLKNPYNFNPVMSNIINLETKVVNFFSFYKNILHSIFINDNNPDPYKVIKIEKPKLPDFNNLKNELEMKFKELKSTGDISDNKNQIETFNQATREIKVDDSKINDPNYYGELKKENPYLRK